MKKNELLKKIDESKDIEYLINLLYDRQNDYKPIENIDVFSHVYKRVNSLNKSSIEDKLIVQIELNNIYVFCMNQLAQIEQELKYEKSFDIYDVNSKMFLGFGLISKKVNNDPITKQILAQKIIKDLLDKKFSCQINDIETDIHKRFYMKSALEKNGITKTIIDIISLYDPHLSDYIACNPRILNDFKHILNGYINNFDSFEEQNEQNRYKFLIDDVKDYCTKNKIDYKSYLLRLAAEYHILNNIIKYSDDYKESDYCNIKDYIISESRNEIDMNYVRLRKVFNNYLNERIVNKKISEKSDEELLKEKMLDYIINIDKMSNEDKLKKAQDIYSYITSKPQFESVVYDLLNHTSIDNQKIVEFKKGI